VFKSRLHVEIGVDMQTPRAHDKSAEDPREVAQDDETRNHEEQSKEARNGKKTDRIDRHRIQGLDLLGNLHRAQFRGDGRAGAAGDHQARQDRAQFTAHGNGDERRHIDDRPHFLQLVGGLHGKNNACEEIDKKDQKNGTQTHKDHLLEDIAATGELAFKRAEDNPIDDTAQKSSNTLAPFQILNDRLADTRNHMHLRPAGPAGLKILKRGVLVIENLEKLVQLGDLKSVLDLLAHPRETQPASDLLETLKHFDQSRQARAVDVFDAGKLHKDFFLVLLDQLVKNLTQLHGRIDVNLPLDSTKQHVGPFFLSRLHLKPPFEGILPS
jgi:hypothetical protein